MYIKLIEKTVDLIFAKQRQPQPTPDRLANCKIIAHRGAVSNDCKENTMAAFEACLGTKVWGIEFDIHWTQDNVPVVHHDEHCGRIFNRADLWINKVSFSKLRTELPLIPSLEEVIQKFGKKLHLMIELKTLMNSNQRRILRDLLLTTNLDLVAVDDFHLLSLNKSFFENIEFVEPKCFLPVAELNVRSMSRAALSNNWAGVAGHYCLINNKIRDRHLGAKQKLGVGYVNSKNSLYRELNRGIHWLFSNKALEVSAHLEESISN